MFTLSKSDQDLLKKISISMMSEPNPIDGWPSGLRVPLQFPPRIKSKSKGAMWIEMDAVFYEPMAIWQGAKKTSVNMEIKYVVADKSTTAAAAGVSAGMGVASAVSGVGGWTIEKIDKAIKTIFAYFYRSMDAASGTLPSMPLLVVSMYDVIPVSGSGEFSKWRIENASVAFGDEIVVSGDHQHPQVSTVTFDLSMVTKISSEGGEFPKMEIDAPDYPAKEWY